MNKEKPIVEEIYEAPAEDLPALAARAINEATCILEDYANKVVKKSDIFNNRWILVNLLHVLYKDIFLLQTEDLDNIIKSNPKNLDKNLSDQCSLCNKDLTCTLEVKGVKDAERTKGVCLDCFISTVKEGDWWDEAWGRLEDEIKS
jgi:hypothetical protein